MQKEKQQITHAVTDDILSLNGPQQNLSALEPDELRNQIQKALSTLCEEDRRASRQRLLAGLAEAGVHVGAKLFILGIPADSLDDPTPSDLGMLLRYIRINTPATIKAIDGLLAELFVARKEPAFIDRRIDEAA